MFDFYPTKDACNIYILSKDKDAIIIDPGTNKNNCLIEHIKKLGVNICYVLLTHCHYDHIGGLKDLYKEFPNIVTYVSFDEEKSLDDPKLNLSLYSSNNNLLTFRPKNLFNVIDNEELNLLGYKIKVIATPFHTLGSVCYYFINENILFSGDTLFYHSVGRSDLPLGDISLMEKSLKKLYSLNDDIIIYPGHECKTTLQIEKKFNPYLKNFTK